MPHHKAAIDQSTLMRLRKTIKNNLLQLGYPQEVYELLKDSMRLLKVRIPIRMDNGSVKVFTGFRVQHSHAIGPTIGGVQFHPQVNESDMNALAMWMSIKSALNNLPFGGAMGGVICDPREMSFRELESLSRGYIRSIQQFISPNKDIIIPDRFTNSQIIAWMLDEYNELNQSTENNFIVGKPTVLGGIQNKISAKEEGIILAIEQSLNKKKLDLSQAKVVVQGFGNVGSYIAEYLHEQGAKVIGISDVYGALHDQAGLDINYLLDRRDSFGTVTKLFDQTISNNELLELECDLLILTAASDQITKDNAHKVQANIIVEATDQSIEEETMNLLTKRNHLFIPNLLTLSGQLLIAYIEQLQNNDRSHWTKEKIINSLQFYLHDTFQNTYRMYQSRDVNMKDASYMVALKRIAEAARFRSWT